MDFEARIEKTEGLLFKFAQRDRFDIFCLASGRHLVGESDVTLLNLTIRGASVVIYEIEVIDNAFFFKT